MLNLFTEFEVGLKDCLEFNESRKSLSVDVDGRGSLGWEVVGGWRTGTVLNVLKSGFWVGDWDEVRGLQFVSMGFSRLGSEGERLGFEFLERWPEVFGCEGR